MSTRVNVMDHQTLKNCRNPLNGSWTDPTQTSTHCKFLQSGAWIKSNETVSRKVTHVILISDSPCINTSMLDATVTGEAVAGTGHRDRRSRSHR